MIPHVHLQRRHTSACQAGRKPHSLSSEADERKRGAGRCHCPIFASGTLNGIFRKLGTRERDWEAARRAIAPYLAANSWDLTSLPPPLLPPPDPGTKPPKPRLPVEEAVEHCLRELEANHSAPNTTRKYRNELAALVRFARAEGIRYLPEFDRPLIRRFAQTWNVSVSTRQTKLSVLKAFFELFVEDELIATNPARLKLRANRAARVGENQNPPRQPYSNEELVRMLRGSRDYGNRLRRWPQKKNGRVVVLPVTPYRDYARRWTGEDLADFIEISYHTGLRISDIATFHVSRLTETGHIKLRLQKNGNWVSVRIPEAVEKMIRDRARRFGPYIFGDRTGSSSHSIYTTWYKRLNQLWEETGPWELPPSHHRFRHTFVRILLEKHTPVEVVARLAGDTVEMIKKHYSQWVDELQEASDRAVEAAFRSMPRLRAL